METTGISYNPHQMIELRYINPDGGENTYAYYKATELEGMLWADPTIEALESLPNGEIVKHKLTRNDISEMFRIRAFDKSKINDLQSRINKITDNMTEDYWYNPNTDAATILQDLCEILDVNPMKTIEFSGTISFSGYIEVPLSETEDFDLESHISDAVTVESYNRGDVDITDWSIDYVNEE